MTTRTRTETKRNLRDALWHIEAAQGVDTWVDPWEVDRERERRLRLAADAIREVLTEEVDPLESSTTVRRPSGWLVTGSVFGWFGATTYAVTAWGGMPWPSVAFWIYAFAMLGALLVGGWLGWREGRGR